MDSNVKLKFCFKPYQTLALAGAAAEHPSQPKISRMHGRGIRHSGSLASLCPRFIC